MNNQLNKNHRTAILAFIIVCILAVGAIMVTTAKADAAPYGGCDEAWQAPTSDGANDCRAHGWTVNSRIVVDPNGVVRMSNLPSCHFEDASGGPIPCSWNLNANDGNNEGVRFYVTGSHRHPRFHYVWRMWPDVNGWTWITDRDAEVMDQSRDWTRCLVRFNPARTQVKCADGYRYTDHA